MSTTHKYGHQQRSYGGVIWTDHALERMTERQVDQGQALLTLTRPQRSRYASAKQAWIYNRTFGSQSIEVVATQNDKREWVVVSVWARDAATMGDRYSVRNPIIDRILDAVATMFSRKKG